MTLFFTLYFTKQNTDNLPHKHTTRSAKPIFRLADLVRLPSHGNKLFLFPIPINHILILGIIPVTRHDPLVGSQFRNYTFHTGKVK